MSTEWRIDVAQSRAQHRSGLVLVATAVADDQYQVQALAGSLPHAVGLSSVEKQQLDNVIRARVEQGGQLLVRAMVAARRS